MNRRAEKLSCNDAIMGIDKPNARLITHLLIAEVIGGWRAYFRQARRPVHRLRRLGIIRPIMPALDIVGACMRHQSRSEGHHISSSLARPREKWKIEYLAVSRRHRRSSGNEIQSTIEKAQRVVIAASSVMMTKYAHVVAGQRSLRRSVAHF